MPIGYWFYLTFSLSKNSYLGGFVANDGTQLKKLLTQDNLSERGPLTLWWPRLCSFKTIYAVH